MQMRAGLFLNSIRFSACQCVFIRHVRPLYSLNVLCESCFFLFFCAFQVKWKIKKITTVDFQQKKFLNMINQYAYVVKMTARIYGRRSCQWFSFSYGTAFNRLTQCTVVYLILIICNFLDSNSQQLPEKLISISKEISSLPLLGDEVELRQTVWGVCLSSMAISNYIGTLV